ncbi:MAG: hypothetical protein HC895_24155 [Leptolyngbyaceae cyanobacterium SM1_3_5]|nr:hypothetical protein [Leptolyngbyaceae cyanobacterium SM1_3_5]
MLKRFALFTLSLFAVLLLTLPVRSQAPVVLQPATPTRSHQTEPTRSSRPIAEALIRSDRTLPSPTSSNCRSRRQD